MRQPPDEAWMRAILDPLLGAIEKLHSCLLYTSDAADERSSVDLGGRRIIKKKKETVIRGLFHTRGDQRCSSDIA
mgnify:CR=1 FL=1